LIEYLPSLFNQAIQHYSCFISYSAKDQEFAERLHPAKQGSALLVRAARPKARSLWLSRQPSLNRADGMLRVAKPPRSAQRGNLAQAAGREMLPRDPGG
jgi:hypothetical protein